jgi:molybdopterin-guanine dinucleotide biosynthesis protein MobB
MPIGVPLVKLIAVVGGKHSGKTTVIEHLINELKSRKYHVGAFKEMVRIPTLDTPATETDRYAVAGAEVIVAVPTLETVVFIKKRLSLKEILPFAKGLDYVLLEGFEHELAIPKIIVAKTTEEASRYLGDSVIAVSGVILDSDVETKKAKTLGLPMFNILTQGKELTDLVEQKALQSS